jgi:hypothetical protein
MQPWATIYAIHNTTEFTPDVSMLAFLSGEIQSTKHYVRNYQLFMQNKPNVKYAQMNVNSYMKSIYEILDTWLSGKNKPNQTQFKPKTNPISKMPKINVSIYYTKEYSNKTAFRRKQNKPNQSQFQTQFFNYFIRVPYTLRGPAMNKKSLAGKSGHTLYKLLCRYSLDGKHCDGIIAEIY